MPAVSLPNRALIVVSGEDAEDFLQGVITTDVAAIPLGETWPGALLTPQGKILYDFLIGRQAEGFVIETAADNADALTRKLTLYRLRAKVVFQRLAVAEVTAVWDEPSNGLVDKRFAIAGLSLTRMAGAHGAAAHDAYHGLRMAHGVTGGGEDGALGDFFPHDLLMDKNSGLSFKKGCYVGQEVVSRMQHRATARRRVVSVQGAAPLGASGDALTAGGREIGTLISVTGAHGLAVARIDKAGAALASGERIRIGEADVAIALPVWTGLEWPSDADDAQS